MYKLDCKQLGFGFEFDWFCGTDFQGRYIYKYINIYIYIYIYIYGGVRMIIYFVIY